MKIYFFFNKIIFLKISFFFVKNLDFFVVHGERQPSPGLILHVDNYVLVSSLLITLICSIIGTQGTEQDN